MRLDCHIVRDLLPSYIEDLTSGETREDIKSHLEECKECTEVYKDMSCELEHKHSSETGKPDPVDFIRRIKKTYVTKVGLGIVVLLCILLRFAFAYTGTAYLHKLEGALYIIVVNIVLWYVCKDLFRMRQRFDKTVILLHVLMLVMSIATAIWLFWMIGITEDGLNHLIHMMGPQNLGWIMMSILWTEIVCVLLTVIYGLYAAIIKSDKYFGLVSHGFGSLVMIFDVQLILRTINLPLNYSTQQEMKLFAATFSFYMVGALLTILYYLYISKRDLPI